MISKDLHRKIYDACVKADKLYKKLQAIRDELRSEIMPVALMSEDDCEELIHSIWSNGLEYLRFNLRDVLVDMIETREKIPELLAKPLTVYFRPSQVVGSQDGKLVWAVGRKPDGTYITEEVTDSCPSM